MGHSDMPEGAFAPGDIAERELTHEDLFGLPGKKAGEREDAPAKERAPAPSPWPFEQQGED